MKTLGKGEEDEWQQPKERKMNGNNQIGRKGVENRRHFCT
jgi:hypothetical protein